MPPIHTKCVLCGVALKPFEGPNCRTARCLVEYARLPAERKCKSCGRPMNPVEMKLGSCSEPTCRTAVVLEQVREANRLRQIEQVRRLELAEQSRQKAAIALGLADPERYTLVVIPAIEPRYVPIPEHRRAEFVENLRRSVTASEKPGKILDGEPIAEVSAEVGAVLGQSCGMCLGKCCGYGGNHAYLQPETIRRFRTLNPQLTSEQIVDAYLAHLVGPTVAGSCIFHHDGGCALTREMRSDTCNRHFCRGLKEFQGTIGDARPIRAFIVTYPDTGPAKAQFVDEAGTRPAPV